MVSDEKLQKIRDFMAATPSQQLQRFESEYRSLAASQDSSDVEQAAWHVETLEEQLSHLSGMLFLESPPDYPIHMFICSLPYKTAQLCIEYINPIMSSYKEEYCKVLWNDFFLLVKCVDHPAIASRSAINTYRLMYLCTFAMGVALKLNSVLSRGLTERHQIFLHDLGVKDELGTAPHVLDTQSDSKLSEGVRSEVAWLESLKHE